MLVAAGGDGLRRSATSRFYTLDVDGDADDAPLASYAVIVGPVTVPASVDRPEFVVQVAPNRVDARRVQPLGRAARREHRARRRRRPRGAARNAARRGGAAGELRSRLSGDDRRPAFESIPGEAAVVDAVWAVRKARGGGARARAGRVAREEVTDKSFDALAAAHSRALATVSGDIAAAIRAEERR